MIENLNINKKLPYEYDEAFKYADHDWQDHVEIDPRYFRPNEVDILVGDSSKAQEKLEWRPEVRFKELMKLMVNVDIEKEKVLLNGSANYKKENNHAIP